MMTVNMLLIDLIRELQVLRGSKERQAKMDQGYDVINFRPSINELIVMLLLLEYLGRSWQPRSEGFYRSLWQAWSSRR